MSRKECRETVTSGTLQHTKVRGVVMCRDLLSVVTPCFRQGAQFVEVWVDGFAFSDLTTRQEELTGHREELEKQKKQLGKKKTSATTISTHTHREQLEREEVLKMRAAVLKKVLFCYQCSLYAV